MPIYFIGCDETQSHHIQNFPEFSNEVIEPVEFPITATSLQIDLLIVGPKIKNLKRLAATISDWKVPPAALFILAKEDFAKESEQLSYHPRVGRSIFFSENTLDSICQGLREAYQFHQKRASLNLDNSVSGRYTINNISPRWLFQAMMEHLDEYIYFKDSDARFLAVSRYLIESCGKKKPNEVLGLRDFDLFDHEHAIEAYHDEKKIAAGELDEVHKEERIVKDSAYAWVASRKLPLYTRSNYLAGSFGLSRDVTKEREMHHELEQNHERIRSEVLMAKNLQERLMQQTLPKFQTEAGADLVEIASKYLPSFHLSGDFYSITKTCENGLAILIADVMGHGVRAAMVTAMIQIAVQQLSELASKPRQFVSELNKMIQQTMHSSGQTLFTTAAYLYLNLETKELTYVQAGARHGVYVPIDTSRKTQLFEKNSISPALGLFPEAHYEETRIQLCAGDEIMLYTDGIIEAAMGEEEYSEKRLIEFLTKHHREDLSNMMETLILSVREFANTEALEDDVCLIALRVL